MSVKELRPRLDPETCSVCGRRLLQGEQVNWFFAPDSTRHSVCELCVPRAERARWVRERGGDEIVELRPARGRRTGFLGRIGEFFGAGEPGEDQSEEQLGHAGGEPGGRSSRTHRRAAAGAPDETALDPEVELETPAELPDSPIERGLQIFNLSQFPRTIAGLSRSLGDPKVAAAEADQPEVLDIWVGWDLAWYSYRVPLGGDAEAVEQSGRGNDVDELIGEVDDWNAAADGFGRLFLLAPEVSDRDEPDTSAT